MSPLTTLTARRARRTACRPAVSPGEPHEVQQILISRPWQQPRSRTPRRLGPRRDVPRRGRGFEEGAGPPHGSRASSRSSIGRGAERRARALPARGPLYRRWGRRARGRHGAVVGAAGAAARRPPAAHCPPPPPLPATVSAGGRGSRRPLPTLDPCARPSLSLAGAARGSLALIGRR